MRGRENMKGKGKNGKSYRRKKNGWRRKRRGGVEKTGGGGLRERSILSIKQKQQ